MIDEDFESKVEAWLAANPPTVKRIAELESQLAAIKQAFAKVLPIRVHDGQDYAEVFFADGVAHSTHAMTMHPQDWRDLAATLTKIGDAS